MNILAILPSSGSLIGLLVWVAIAAVVVWAIVALIKWSGIPIPQPVWIIPASKQMRFLYFLAFGFASCSTTLYSPASGKPLARVQSDLLNVSYTGGGVTFRADKMSNSIPTRAALLGANRIVGTFGSAAIGLAVPGSGTAPLVTRAAITAVPHVTTPASSGQ